MDAMSAQTQARDDHPAVQTCLRILHCHSTFTLGGKEARAARLINAWGERARHVILSGIPGAIGAREAIDAAIKVTFPTDAPSLSGRPSVGRYQALAHYMRTFDLVLTYNWGALDAVMARRLNPKAMPPLVHHEDGFNADEAGGLKRERNLFRRIAFPAAHAIALPSHRLEQIARDIWKQPPDKIVRISNGIDVKLYSRVPDPKAIPGFEPTPGEVVVGTLAGLRGVKNLPMLVRAVAKAGPNIRLIIVGEGPERDAILAEAAQCGMTERLVLPGFLPNPHKYVGLFDIFALSSDSEQFPISLVEAMAAARPVVSTNVGDVSSMLDAMNRTYLVRPRDDDAMAAVIAKLAADKVLRLTMGISNRDHARTHFDEKVMIGRYADLYERAVGRPGALSGT
jgi:L-malate glycosyltransferase